MHRPLEQRTTRGTVEFRAAKPGKKMPGMQGYALKFKKRSQDLGGFYEDIAPTAVNKSLGDKLDVLARQHHRDEYLLGRTGAGTLALRKDDVGLIYDVAELPDTTFGRDLAVQLERGDIAHSSFAFHAMEDDWSTTEDGTPLRTLVSIRLVDVAPVVTPAYLDTSAAVRSLAAHLDRDLEDITELLRRGEAARVLTKATVLDLAPAPAEHAPEAPAEAAPEPAEQQAADDSATAEEKSLTAQAEVHAANDLRSRRLTLMARRPF